MTLKAITNTNAPAGGTSAPDIVIAGALGATHAETVVANLERWLSGTLTANHTLTLTMAAGSRLRLFGTQDATGGRTLTISDGTTSVPVPITAIPAATFEIDVYADGSTLHINTAASAVAVPTPDALVAPYDPRGADAFSIALANRIHAMRCRVPLTGRLRDLYVFCGTTAANNVIGCVFDTGQAALNTSTRLWVGATVALPGTNNQWVSLGDPNLAVNANQFLDLGFICDNASPTFARRVAATNALAQMPTANFLASGRSSQLAWVNDPGSFAVPATISDGVTPADASHFLIVGRIS